MIQIKLTPAQYAARAAKVAQAVGVVITGDAGAISHSGVTANYRYDGTELAINVTHWPFFLSEAEVENKILAWFAAGS